MRLLVIDNAEPQDFQFNQPLIEYMSSSVECDVVNYFAIPQPAVLEQTYHGIILSGVPLHYRYDSADTRLMYYDWLKTTKLPTLGICLGHQIIGKLYGAKLLRGMEAEKGVLATYIEQNDLILNNIPPVFSSYLMHRASITVPESFEVLATTDMCKNIIMRHRERPIYGLQLHPELSPVGLQILQNFLALADPALAVESPPSTPPVTLPELGDLPQVA